VRRRSFITLLGATGLPALPRISLAQTYPTRPVRIIVPSLPGGGTDTVARLLTQHLTETLGQQFYVENRPGAGSMTGIEVAARSSADGYTLLITPSAMSSLHIERKNMRYNAIKDFAPITLIMSIPNVLAINPSLPVHTFMEFIAYATAHPGTLTYATAGSASISHLGMELLNASTGIEMLHIPYNGVTLGLTDVLAGRVPVMMLNVASTKGYVDSGALRALAVTGHKRSPAFPDLPTVAELGITNYEAYQWFGLLAPANTPKNIIALLHNETTAAIRMSRIITWMQNEGGDPVGNTPNEFLNLITNEVEKWNVVAKTANIIQK
jgi:tripartite-type tricarboxylate transporter receptor subunit TctC